MNGGLIRPNTNKKQQEVEGGYKPPLGEGLKKGAMETWGGWARKGRESTLCPRGKMISRGTSEYGTFEGGGEDQPQKNFIGVLRRHIEREVKRE